MRYLMLVLLLSACAPYPTNMTTDDWVKVMTVGAAQGCMYFRGTGNPPASNLNFVLVQKYGSDTPKFDIKQCFEAVPAEVRGRLLGGY